MTAGFDRSGLDPAEAAARLARDGPNVLPPARGPAAWRLLFHQVTHFFALMLWGAAVLAFIAGLPQLGVAISVIVVLNGVFAFAQEFRSERAAERLHALLPRQATVVRGGSRLLVDASDLVIGDLVVLQPGDRIGADMDIVEAAGLAADVSTMTGESAAVPLATGDTGLAGTFVVSGEGLGVVTAVAAATRLAALARATRTRRRPRSPLAQELDRVVRVVTVIALGVGLSFFAVAMAVGSPPSEGLIFAIGVTVALVPEGLLPTVTLSLATGAQRMSRRAALVRRLESVETLGATSFICTDKTGTLTRNQMEVVEAWTPHGSVRIAGGGYGPTATVTTGPGAGQAARDLAVAGALASEGRAALEDGEWVARGDPMEAALDAFARRLGFEPPAEAPTLVFPFDAERRRMSVFADGYLYVKGAPEAVLPVCWGNMADAGEAVSTLAGRGLRVLAVAVRRLPHPPVDALAAERDLDLLGLVGLQDPPREGVEEALAACRRAGIRVLMITGDHPATALAIGRQIGLASGAGIVFEGGDLPADEQVLGAMLDRDGAVVARVSPEQKLDIARALQARGHVVAMTGDGVNDGPALQQADIGVAMGRSGTDVARDAADLVLLDDNFLTIVAAVEEGRTTFSNIRRFMTYHLTDNVAELTPFVVWALSGGSVPLAIGVLQVLCLDIGTDLLPALALGSERPAGRAFLRPLTGQHLVDAPLLRRVFMLLGPLEALFSMGAFLAAMWSGGWRFGDAFPGGVTLEAASGAAFTTVVLMQATNAFACRSATRPPWALGWTTNRLLLGAVAAEAVLLLVFLFAPGIPGVLGQRPPPWEGLLVAVAGMATLLAADAAQKAFIRRRDPGGD